MECMDNIIEEDNDLSENYIADKKIWISHENDCDLDALVNFEIKPPFKYHKTKNLHKFDLESKNLLKKFVIMNSSKVLKENGYKQSSKYQIKKIKLFLKSFEKKYITEFKSNALPPRNITTQKDGSARILWRNEFSNILVTIPKKKNDNIICYASSIDQTHEIQLYISLEGTVKRLVPWLKRMA